MSLFDINLTLLNFIPEIVMSGLDSDSDGGLVRVNSVKKTRRVY